MGLADDGMVKMLIVALAFSLFALVGIAAFGVVAGLSALFTASPTTPLVVALFSAVAPYAIAAALVGIISFVLSLGLAVAAVRQASMPRNDRLARLARLVERHSSEARQVGLAERFEPTTEERIEALKQEYVEGEITELEYERRLQDLMSEEGVGDERVRSEYEGSDRKRREREYEW